MIAAGDFIAAAQAAGIGSYAGVPCSFLTPLINGVVNGAEGGAAVAALDYVSAASEGEACAIAAGAWLAGRGSAVICQNSGLGNMVNPLTSLQAPFRIPTLLVTTWRGEPGRPDEPQHEMMGRITHRLLELMEIPHAPFPSDAGGLAAALAEAAGHLRARRCFALVMSQGSVADEALRPAPAPARPRAAVEDRRTGAAPPARAALLERLLALVPDDAAIIATTGKCGRELFTLADRPQHLYQVGSMGCAAGMGLGVARAVGRRTIVLDGDGAALMKLGTQATVGTAQPENLLHVLLDNGVHDSTGGQPTAAPGVDFPAVAAACGYRRVIAVDDVAGFADAFGALCAPKAMGPALLHARIAPGSLAKLGRPTIAPHEVAARFRAFLADA